MKKTNKILSLVLAVVMLLSTFGVSAFAASTSKTGLYKVNGTWCYVKNGKVDYSVTGLFKHTNGKWYYVEDGRVDFGFTGLAKRNGIWYYVEDGRVDFDFTGLAKRNGIWYYVEDGRVDFGFTGLAKRNGKWYYVEDGRVDFDFTGLAKRNGKWYYVEDGRVDFDFNGLVKRNGKWYYVEAGRVDFTYTGLAGRNGKLYYVKDGVVDFSYSGLVTHNGEIYNVVNGVVVSGIGNVGDTSPEIKPDGDLEGIADVVKAINDATANAVNSTYDWTREAQYTESVDMGSATDVLNNIIQGVDANASLDSVIGGFLGVGTKSGAVTNGVSDGSIQDKYLLKATTLTTDDIKQFRVSGNIYMIQINDCTNPDANSSIAHATNDYITYTEVNQSITAAVGDSLMSVNETGTNLAYKNIILSATIEDGQLTNLEYSYTFDFNLSLKVYIMNTTGTGATKTKATYSNFEY